MIDNNDNNDYSTGNKMFKLLPKMSFTHNLNQFPNQGVLLHQSAITYYSQNLSIARLRSRDKKA